MTGEQPNSAGYRPDYLRMVKYTAMFVTIQVFLAFWMAKFFIQYYGSASGSDFTKVAIWWTLIATALYLIGRGLDRYAPSSIIWITSPFLVASGIWMMHIQFTSDPITIHAAALLGVAVASPLVWGAIPNAKKSLMEQYLEYLGTDDAPPDETPPALRTMRSSHKADE